MTQGKKNKRVVYSMTYEGLRELYRLTNEPMVNVIDKNGNQIAVVSEKAFKIFKRMEYPNGMDQDDLIAKCSDIGDRGIILTRLKELEYVGLTKCEVRQ